MTWIFRFATEIVSATALVSVASAIAGFLLAAKHNKNAIVVTLNGTRSEFANLESHQVQAVLAELSKGRSSQAADTAPKAAIET